MAEPLITWLEKFSGAKLDDSDKELVTELAATSERFPTQLYQWVGHTLRLAEELADGSLDENVVSLFWIRLWGVFEEIIPWLQKLANHLPGADGGFLDRFHKLKALLSDEELIFAEYLRQSQVHLAPRMIDVKPTGKNKVTGTFQKADTTYKGRSIYELRKCIDAIWTKAETSAVRPEETEAYTAREVARKICQPLKAIYDDMWFWIHA